MPDPIYAGTTIEVAGRPAVVHGCRRWGSDGGPRPGSPLYPGAEVSAVRDDGPVLARLTTDGWTEVG